MNRSKALIVSIVSLVSLALVNSTLANAHTVTNLKNVISGRFYTSGSTDRKPLSNNSLEDLCEQGYTLAVFVYSGAEDQTVSCSRGTIRYLSMTNWKSPSRILELAQDHIRSGGKVLVHCWYGVHASNFVGSVALNRFCGFSGSEAAQHFISGVPRGSLGQSRLNELMSELENLGSGSGSMSGCP